MVEFPMKAGRVCNRLNVWQKRPFRLKLTVSNFVVLLAIEDKRIADLIASEKLLVVGQILIQFAKFIFAFRSIEHGLKFE